MSERWYKEAVVYCVEVDSFQDPDGDGCGDLAGLTSRLDYLARLGVTCLWLNRSTLPRSATTATTSATTTA